MLLTYKTLHGTTLVYIHVILCDMLNWYGPSRSLRYGANRHNTITYDRRLCDAADQA